MTSIFISPSSIRCKTLPSLDNSPEILSYSKEPTINSNKKDFLQERKKTLKEFIYVAFIVLSLGLSIISIIISSSLKKDNNNETNPTEKNYFLSSINFMNKTIDGQKAEINLLKNLISKMQNEINEKYQSLSKYAIQVDEKGQEKNQMVLDLFQNMTDVYNNQTDFTQKINSMSTNISKLNSELINVTKNLVDTNLTQIIERSEVLGKFIVSTDKFLQYSNYMYTAEGLNVYDDIFLALEASEIRKFGNPFGWDIITYRKSPYLGKKMFCMLNNDKHEGIFFNATKKNYTLLWLRIPLDMPSTFGIYELNEDNQVILESWEKYGLSQVNPILPDGGSSGISYHQWISIPIRKKINYLIKTEENSMGWISGMALGQNLWNHAKNFAHLFLIENSGVLIDQRGNIFINSYGVLQVSVIPNGLDKILYFAGVRGENHQKIQINGKTAESLRVGFGRDVFATHYSKNLYMGTKVPKEWISEEMKTLKVEIYVDKDQGENSSGFYFMEAGTHDYI